MLRRPIEFVRARRPFHGLEVRDGVGLFPGFPERLRAAAGLSAHLAAPRTPPDVERTHEARRWVLPERPPTLK